MTWLLSWKIQNLSDSEMNWFLATVSKLFFNEKLSQSFTPGLLVRFIFLFFHINILFYLPTLLLILFYSLIFKLLFFQFYLFIFHHLHLFAFFIHPYLSWMYLIVLLITFFFIYNFFLLVIFNINNDSLFQLFYTLRYNSLNYNLLS